MSEGYWDRIRANILRKMQEGSYDFDQEEWEFLRRLIDDASDDQGQVERLRRLIESLYDFGQTRTGDPYLVLKSGANIARPIRGNGGDLRPELSCVYADRYGTIPGQQSLSAALMYAHGRCLRVPHQDSALRFAQHENSTVLDLGSPNGWAIVVTPDSWRVVERSPVLFRRTALTCALPEPMRGGSLATLRPVFRMSDDDWWLLVACWLFDLLKPNAPRIVRRFGGEHGSAKSTSSRLAGRFLDPSEPWSRQASTNVEDWNLATAGSFVAVLDNLSSISPELSDLMCKASTGEGSITRARYSVDDLLVVSFRRSLIYNGIGFAQTRPDLMDRLVAFRCETISEEDQREEAEVLAEFDQAWPSALGGLLDLAVLVLRELPTVRLDRLPRMADFAKLVAAMDRVLETSALARYLAQRSELAIEAGEGDQVGVAIHELMVGLGGKSWEGTMGDLLERITPKDNKGNLQPPKDWPKNPQGMRSAYDRVAPSLRALGITREELGRSNRGQRYRLTYDSGSRARTSQGSSPSSPSSPEGKTAGQGPGTADPPGEDRVTMDSDRHGSSLGPEGKTAGQRPSDDDDDGEDALDRHPDSADDPTRPAVELDQGEAPDPPAPTDPTSGEQLPAAAPSRTVRGSTNGEGKVVELDQGEGKPAAEVEPVSDRWSGGQPAWRCDACGVINIALSDLTGIPHTQTNRKPSGCKGKYRPANAPAGRIKRGGKP